MASTSPFMLFAGPVLEFLENEKAGGKTSGTRSIVTHTCMTGGKYHLDAAKQNEFYDIVAKALEQQPDVVIPCVTEQRTTVFGLYIDFDGKFPVEDLTPAAIEKFMSAVTRQLRRFYEGVQEERWKKLSRSIVLRKTGGVEMTGDGLYKHGMHIHFPNLLVKGDQARQIRLGIINGLIVMTWKEEFGIERPDWDTVIDHQVYTNGLRMVGAPKALKCKTCGAKPEIRACKECFKMNFGHHIIPHVYLLSMAFENGGVSQEYYDLLKKNTNRLVRATSVRSEHLEETEGYKVYDGCPPYQEGGGARRNGKRPIGVVNGDVAKMDSKFRAADDITDPAKVEVIHQLMCNHSEMYRSCYPTKIRKTNDTTIKVTIGGDNATYCLNLRGKHRSNRVYMEISKGGKGARMYGSSMKCFCRCATPRAGEVPRPGDPIPISNRTCGEFTSFRRSLTTDQVRVLFPTKLEVEKKNAENLNIPEDELEEYLCIKKMEQLDRDIKRFVSGE